MAELRDLAHGIYPAVLTESGLATALESLSDIAPIALELRALPSNRSTNAAEAAAYVAISEGITDAAARAATSATVQVTQEDRHLVVSVTDDGSPRRADLVQVADRIGALGGSVNIGPQSLTAVIPCE